MGYLLLAGHNSVTPPLWVVGGGGGGDAMMYEPTRHWQQRGYNKDSVEIEKLYIWKSRETLKSRENEIAQENNKGAVSAP
jgi:hypothetical protein